MLEAHGGFGILSPPPPLQKRLLPGETGNEDPPAPNHPELPSKRLTATFTVESDKNDPHMMIGKNYANPGSSPPAQNPTAFTSQIDFTVV